jgi:hypothetical protein
MKIITIKNLVNMAVIATALLIVYARIYKTSKTVFTLGLTSLQYMPILQWPRYTLQHYIHNF